MPVVSPQYIPGPESEGSGGTFAGSPPQSPQYMPGPDSEGSGGTFGGKGAQPGSGLGTSPLANSASPGVPGSSSSAGGDQTFGGGAIVGVASLSKDPTIRIYNKKKKYRSEEHTSELQSL